MRSIFDHEVLCQHWRKALNLLKHACLTERSVNLEWLAAFGLPLVLLLIRILLVCVFDLKVFSSVVRLLAALSELKEGQILPTN